MASQSEVEIKSRLEEAFVSLDDYDPSDSEIRAMADKVVDGFSKFIRRGETPLLLKKTDDVLAAYRRSFAGNPLFLAKVEKIAPSIKEGILNKGHDLQLELEGRSHY